jgi:hypothetical protein
MLDEGVYPHQSALARGEGVTAAAVSLAFRKLREASAVDGCTGSEGVRTSAAP